MQSWKSQLTIAFNFISSKDSDKERTMHSKSDYIEVMTYDNLGKIIEELFDLLLSRYHIGLGTQMKESGFIFD